MNSVSSLIAIDRSDEPRHCLAARDDFRAQADANQLLAVHALSDPAIYRAQMRSKLIGEFPRYLGEQDDIFREDVETFRFMRCSHLVWPLGARNV